MSKLSDLCQIYTGLNEDQIRILEDLAGHLPLFAELTTDNVFIDCLVDERTAVVVAEAEPSETTGLYGRSVVGEMALIEKEPAVFHAFRTVMPICDLKGITQENKAVRQNVIPVRDDDDRIIAVLIREKDISKEIQKEKQYQQLAEWHRESASSTRYLREAEPEELSQDAIEGLLATREIHHRIKNNLQLVASFLNLQALNCRDEEAASALREGISRIRSISVIHEILVTQGEAGQQVSFMKLIGRLTEELRNLYGCDGRIAIVSGGDDLELDLHTATSAAIVVNELVTNALKHAFPGERKGEIRITAVRGTQFHTVTVKDDGRGFDLTEAAPDSLGLELIRSTVSERLGGKLHIFSDENGTRVSFDFREAACSHRS